ncbi:MAG: hypothetical protein ACYC3P_06350 [Bellilinea sp.]
MAAPDPNPLAALRQAQSQIVLEYPLAELVEANGCPSTRARWLPTGHSVSELVEANGCLHSQSILRMGQNDTLIGDNSPGIVFNAFTLYFQ